MRERSLLGVDVPPTLPEKTNRLRWLRDLGPGLITGASDDDPSGIATYSQAGAQFGYSMAWSRLITYPLMAAVQEISARIGRMMGPFVVTGVLRILGWATATVIGLAVVAMAATSVI